jgi:hypothetical protein
LKIFTASTFFFPEFAYAITFSSTSNEYALAMISSFSSCFYFFFGKMSMLFKHTIPAKGWVPWSIHRTENFETFLRTTEGTVSHVPTFEKEWIFGRVLPWC